MGFLVYKLQCQVLANYAFTGMMGPLYNATH